MTRTGYDSISLDRLPPDGDLYAGYDDGNWPDAESIAQRFPGKTVIRVTVTANDDEGDCLDVENGDATPAQAPGWVQRRRQAGHGGPLVYCSEASWSAVRQAFQAQGVPEPGYWVAAYPGEGPVVPAGAVGHQYGQGAGGTYDVSVFVDYLPGIDPAPATSPSQTDPPVPNLEDPDVTSEQYGGSVHIFGHDANNQPCHWWQSLNEGVPAAQADWAWHVEKLPNG